MTESPQLDRVFHALADATRRSILRGIAGKEKTVSEIAQPYQMSLAAVCAIVSARLGMAWGDWMQRIRR